MTALGGAGQHDTHQLRAQPPALLPRIQGVQVSAPFGNISYAFDVLEVSNTRIEVDVQAGIQKR